MLTPADPVDAFRVALLLTEQCNVSCAHCWFGCGPGKTARMALGEAVGYIDQAAEIPTMRWISFTGGEPFLLPEMLLSLVGYASDKGLHTECVTNCFWAEREKTAERALKPLAEAGLDAINISADDFHQRQIPFERVRNCYEAARMLGLKIVIMCAAARSSRLRIGEVVRLLGDEKIRIVGGVTTPESPSALAVETGFIPAGRARGISAKEIIVGNKHLDGPCTAVLRDVTIDPTGRILPCCSAAGAVDSSAIGNAKRGNLKTLIREARERPLFKVLRAQGPAGLSRLLSSEPSSDYVNRCHLCYEALTDHRLSLVL